MAAPAILQHKSNFVTAGNPVTAAFTNPVTAGSMILVWGGMAQNSDFTVPTMTGETFTKVTGASNAGTATNGRVSLYVTNSAVGGQALVSLGRVTGNADIHIHILEISGQAASPQDATGNTESTTLSVVTSGSTTTANDLVIAFFFDNANNRTFAAAGGYAQVEQSNNTTGGDVGFSEFKTISVTGTQTATATGNAGDITEQGIIAIAGTAGGGSFTPDEDFWTNYSFDNPDSLITVF